MEMGDILLKKGADLAAVLIRYVTADGEPYSTSYSHCGICAGDNKVYDARYPQIGLHDLDYGDYDVYHVPLTEWEKAQLISFCESKKGVHYALEGVIDEGIQALFHIPVNVNLHGEEWCSLFVNLAFASIGKPLTRKPYPYPNDIAWSVVPSKVS